MTTTRIPRFNRMGLLISGLMMGGVGHLAFPRDLCGLSGGLPSKAARGLPLGLGAAPNEVFKDSRGQAYVRDERGVIRRA